MRKKTLAVRRLEEENLRLQSAAMEELNRRQDLEKQIRLNLVILNGERANLNRVANQNVEISRELTVLRAEIERLRRYNEMSDKVCAKQQRMIESLVAVLDRVTAHDPNIEVRIDSAIKNVDEKMENLR